MPDPALTGSEFTADVPWCETFDVKPGDTLRYRMTGAGVLLDKASANEADDPFAAFSEWSNEADEKAYGSL